MSKKTRHAWQTLLGLCVIITIAIGAVVIGHFTSTAGFTPKLALDLEGGTQVILTPKMADDADSRGITSEDMNEAINIIRQRIDASGVSEAEISTLGSNNIVVSIPGEPDEDTLNLIRTSATMRFRPVLLVGAPQAIDPSELAQSGQDKEEYGKEIEKAAKEGTLSDEPQKEPTDNSDLSWVTDKLYYEFLTTNCTDPAQLAANDADNPAKAVVACGVDGDAKYLLGPADVEGSHISKATAGMIYSSAGQATGQWGVDLEFDKEGTNKFAESSKRLYELKGTDDTRNRFAVVLDGNVITAPSMNATISDGRAQISGNFTAQSAQALANQLSFGSLPLNFDVQSEQQISATLGTNHLEKGILAGIIGLILVVLWMILQYRGLSLISAGSLLVAAGTTYVAITLLSWIMGYRLSLPGVAGLIVAVGITADSFIVYFERIRDEVRDGSPMTTAVEHGWKRAKRTIIISDMVNLVAAIVLYVLAVGGVQGFAFTLGLTTLIDLMVIFWFTHPMMVLLMNTRFFGGGHKLSGLDPEHLGAASSVAYVGRGKVRVQGSAVTEETSITQRKRQEQLVAASTSATDSETSGEQAHIEEQSQEQADRSQDK